MLSRPEPCQCDLPILVREEAYFVGVPGTVLTRLVRGWKQRVVLVSEILAKVLYYISQSIS